MYSSTAITQTPSGQDHLIGSMAALGAVAVSSPVAAGGPVTAGIPTFANRPASATKVITYGIWKQAHTAITRRGAPPL